VFSLWSVPRSYKRDESHNPCGGEVEYLYRDPDSRRRRRKWKSQIWESKIWSRVSRDSDPRKTALVMASSIYKRQTRPLVREGAPQKQDRNCQTIISIWGSTPRLTDWLTVSSNVTLTLTLTCCSRYQETSIEDREDLICSVFTVIFRVCNSAIVLQLFVVTTCKWSINPILNPNPVYSHSNMWR
jgi:hypothetical protein